MAKTAAGLHKPNGLDFIDKSNYQLIYQSLNLMDLCGIKAKNAIRLNNKGVFSVWDFYNADSFSLKSAFGSIIGYWWYLRLRGWEVDDVEWGRKSYGNSFSLPKPLTTVEELSPILRKLVEKTGFRLRKAGYKIAGVHLAILFRDGDFWHKGVSVSQPIFDSGDIYKITFKILNSSPVRKPVRELAVSCFNLKKSKTTQLALFEDVSRKERLVKSLDKINDHWGQFVITPATMLGTKDTVIDRVAFGGVKELEEIVTID